MDYEMIERNPRRGGTFDKSLCIPGRMQSGQSRE